MQEQKRLKIGIISNCPVSGKTGLARNQGSLLPVLYRLNKYDFFFLAQGMQDGDPNFQKLPWPTFGVFKNIDQNRWNSDDGYKRWISYGNGAVADFVINNKLDIVIHSDDIWSSDFQNYCGSDWFQYIKSNFVQHTTCDSLPILPDFKKWAESGCEMWFWTSFAEKVLKEENFEKYKHCKTVHGAININHFKPLSKQERLDLRHKFGITNDEKVFIYLSRNQLRKAGFWADIEAFAKFKKKHPDKKIKLLYHCYINEPGGWPIDRIREECGLKKEDILVTYYCRTCGAWNIEHYIGEDLDCQVCKTQKARITAGVGSTINEIELNKIYNIADASTSYPTSAGLEYCNVESLLAGIPLSTTPYAGTSEFTFNDFVHSIRGTFTREVGTSFQKHVPDIDSIVEFFEYIHDLPESKRKEISEKGRKWAIEQFDANNISKIYEKFFDSCKPINWDSYLSKKSELKNPSAQVPHIQDDKEWLKTLYKEILKMEVKDDDSGLLFWIGELAQKKRSRPDIENYFRMVGNSENMKKQNIGLESLLDKEDKERVLLTLKESMGDHYLLTALLPEIKNKYPEAAIYIGCDPKYFDIYDNNEYIRKCIPWMPEMDNEMQMTGFGGHKGLFNYYHNVGIGTQKLLNYLNSKY